MYLFQTGEPVSAYAMTHHNVITFINVVLTWLNINFHDVNITLSKEDFVLGSKTFSRSLNTILLLSKQYSYSCKMNISLPNINVFKNIVKAYMNIEKYQAYVQSMIT